MNANMFNLPRMNRNIGGRRNTVHFLFFLTRFQFLTAKIVLISFDNLILSIRSRSPAQRFHHSRANQTTLERQFVSAPGHSYYNCNTTKTSVALPIRAWFDWCPVPTAVKRGYRDPHGSMAAYFEMLLWFCAVDNSFGTRGMCNWFWENHLYVFLLSSR